VLARKAAHGAAALIAYLVPIGSAPTIQSLREHLVKRLPEYMIPADFVFLDALPLTPNGKLDRAALPSPDQNSVARGAYEAPVGAVEAKIADIWQALLALPRIGRHDNFFELGGHSLLVVKVVAAIKAEFARPIPMAWVFQAPTPARLAALMGQQRPARAWQHMVALNDGVGRNPLFCLNGFDGDVDSYLHIARLVDASVPVYGLETGALGNDKDFGKSIDSRMDAYQREIRSVQPKGPYRLCGYSFGGSEAFDLARRLEDAGEEVVLILLDAFRPCLSLVVRSWGPRFASQFKAGAILSIVRRKLQELFKYEMHHLLTGKDRDLRHALFRDAMNRKYKAFSGKAVLFTTNGIEEWPFQLRLDGFNGWKKYVTGPFSRIHIDAWHVDLMKEPAVKAVVSHLNSILTD
jgi:thioesterase domain-containing protein